jgi:plasmid maintenance system antidote protein VapI
MKFYTEGELFKVLREKFQPRAGQTQTQTAAKLGFSVQFINMVLDGQRPVTKDMASALGFRECPRRFTRKATAKP